VEMFTGQPLFPTDVNLPQKEFESRVQNLKTVFNLNKYCHIIMGMLTYDPMKRLTAEQALVKMEQINEFILK
jgi:hypothetical protein